MATLSIQTKVTVDEFVEAAEQLQTPDLEKLTYRLMQINARRRATNVPQREVELLEGIARFSTFERQERYRLLASEMQHRSLTPEEQTELHELNAVSETQTAQRLALLVELSQLRQVSLPGLMKQLQIKAPGIV